MRFITSLVLTLFTVRLFGAPPPPIQSKSMYVTNLPGAPLPSAVWVQSGGPLAAEFDAGLIKILDPINGELNIRSFPGIVGDGVNDDTAGIQAAYDAVKLTGGGLLLPVPPVNYKFNLVIKDNNISLRGLLPNVSAETQVMVKAADPTKPVIQIADDTGVVYGTRIEGIGICVTNAAYGIRLGGGAVQTTISRCSLIGGTNVLFWAEAGTTYPVTQLSLYDCDLWDMPTGTGIRIKYPSPGSFTTGVNFFGVRLHSSHKTADYGLEVDRGQALTIYGGYFDMTADHAVHILNGARIQGYGTRFDNQAGSGLVTVDWGTAVNPDLKLGRYLQGSFELLGSVKWIDSGGTVETWLNNTTPGSISPPFYGLQCLGGYELKSDQYFQGDVHFATALDPPGTTTFSIGANSVITNSQVGLTFFREGLTNQDTMRMETIATNHFYIFNNPGGDVDSQVNFDFSPTISTKHTYFQFGRTTQTAGTRAFSVFKGDGTATLSSQINMATGDLWTLGKLEWGGDTTVHVNSTDMKLGDGTDSNVFFDVNAPSISTKNLTMRIGRSTTTSGAILFDVMKGDGSTTVGVELRGDTGSITGTGPIQGTTVNATQANGFMANGVPGGTFAFTIVAAGTPTTNWIFVITAGIVTSLTHSP